MLAVRLADGRAVLTQRLPAALARAVAAYLADAGPGEPAATSAGDPYTSTAVEDLVVEVLEGTTRHQVVTATRLR
ncbi:hypothetical protein [Streptomyces sp. NPDC051909]|uniref:hypothetical protein n=1 Tax=Streptomyces sp. NPDC051909 TaxID=3154944 RepID=UPI0034398D9D